ncbi:ankyrin repeat-containing domain protein [Cladorrhinum samala]|uniref:Ankyrin repeat-containing domain protein n=1 Tax=Cladorrhinum samala TaxID=585594 RepID=A0AAV9HQ32_9PEZI|nr:ankyrin repeat-containing domain protein [Cladorrhinum samala]
MLCQQCGRDFKDQRQLRQHVRWHDKKYRCKHEKCRDKRGFACQKDLARHQRTHDQIKGTQCPYCNRKISRLDNLEKHLTRAHKNIFWVAVISGDEATVKLLLQDGGDGKPKDIDNNMALVLATAKGHAGIVNLLLDNGADIEAKGNPRLTLREIALTGAKPIGWSGMTPLAVASKYGHEAVVEALLQRKAAVNNNGSESPLTYAACRGHASIVKLLLEAGADVNARGCFDTTALYLAAATGHEAVVRLLIDAGASVRGRGKMIPLSQAAREGHVAIVKLLMDHGAVPGPGGSV